MVLALGFQMIGGYRDLILVASILLVVSLSNVLAANDQPNQKPAQSLGPNTTVRSVEQIPEALRHNLKHPLNVDFEATITYWDPDRVKIFVQDGAQAIYVQTKTDMRMIGKPKHLNRVRVVGTVNPSEGHVRAQRFELLETIGTVTPIQIELAELPKGMHWSKLVQIQGTLIRVVATDTHTQLVLQSGTRKCVCTLRGTHWEMKYGPAIGNRFQAVGVLDWEIYESGAPRQASLLIADESRIKDISASTQTQSDYLNLESLEDAEALPAQSRICVRGAVTFISPGKDFVIEDETGGMIADLESSDMISLGDTMQVYGTLIDTPQGRRLDLERATWSNRAVRPRPVIRCTAREVVGEQIDHRRIAIGGTVTDLHISAEHNEIILQDEGFTFRVLVPGDSRLSVMSIDVGQRLFCQGFVLHDSDAEQVWFSVRAQDAESIFPDNDNRLHFNRTTIVWWFLGIGGITSAILLWIGTMRSQVKRKTQHLADLTASLNASYEAIQEGIVIADSAGRVVAVNKQFGKITGIQPSVGSSTASLRFHLERRYGTVPAKKLWNLWVAHQPVSTDLELASDDGSQKLVAYLAPVPDENGTPIGTLLAVQDVTKQQELESRLRQSQKMEAVGQLAGGIAHDFNNLLTVMGFNVRHTRQLIAEGHPEIIQSLDDTQLAVDRATKLVQNLLGFSRQSRLNLSRVSVNSCVENVVSLLRRTLPSNIELETQLDADLHVCKLDQGQIEQVIMNICLNARDAIGGRRGVIEIETGNTTIQGEPGVLLRVTDNGKGMTERTRQRLFEPFYTTKPLGQGTGLGMATSYGIVSQHRGEIDCQSEVDVGTQISVYLPASNESGMPANDKPPRNTTTQLCGKVLVVDDDPAVRRATKSMMVSLGCDVVEADSGKTALQLITVQEFDLVILDLNMPEMSGQQVFDQLIQTHPDLPVVICTGYLATSDHLLSRSEAPAAVLHKPYSRSQVFSICEPFLASST